MAKKKTVEERLEELFQSDESENLRAVAAAAGLDWRTAFAGANLEGADLSAQKLRNIDLSEANLDNSDISKADLSNANLSLASLEDADLSGTKFTNADLSGASLRNAKVVGTDFVGADLTNTDLSGIDIDQLIIDEQVRRHLRAPPIGIMLQGSGNLGAFQWGVLDWILECFPNEIEAITACGAGAINGAALVSGYHTAGRDGARESLDNLWRAIGGTSSWESGYQYPMDLIDPTGSWRKLVDNWYRGFWMLGPYQLNPLNVSPLRNIIEKIIDFEAIRNATVPKLFITVADVRTGRARVFDAPNLIGDAVLASASHPLLQQAVEIDGSYYWEGSLAGGPLLHPLILDCATSDLLIIRTNAFTRPDTPRTGFDIIERALEISANSVFLKELRGVSYTNELIDQGEIDGARVKQLRLHSIDDDGIFQNYGVDARYSSDWNLLTTLRDIGRHSAERWFDAHGDAMHEYSTFSFHDLEHL